MDRDRVLVVADWRADARGVVNVAERRAAERPATFRVVVPAWLHGLDWIGDPRGSRPCAEAQVEALQALWRAAGLDLAAAEVGDPDPVATGLPTRRVAIGSRHDQRERLAWLRHHGRHCVGERARVAAP